VIAGDYLYIGRHLPLPASGALAGKIILTNTTTEEDIKELTKRGARLLITTTPNFEGRSFGTNVMEAVLVAHHNGAMLTPDEYMTDLNALGWTPTTLCRDGNAAPLGLDRLACLYCTDFCVCLCEIENFAPEKTKDSRNA
jgi:hypothetical protein